MEFLTLSFKNEDYENLYREQIHKKELNLFVSTIKGVIMVGMIGVSVSIVYGNLFNLLIWLGIMIIILLAYFYSRKSYEVMDYAAMFMSLTLNVYMQYLFLNKNFFADTKTIL